MLSCPHDSLSPPTLSALPSDTLDGYQRYPSKAEKFTPGRGAEVEGGKAQENVLPTYFGSMNLNELQQKLMGKDSVSPNYRRIIG